MDAIDMLQIEHKAAKKVMEDILASSGEQRKTLFTALKQELEDHDTVEEDIFYPAVQSHPKTMGFPGEDKQAHTLVEKALGELAEMPIEDARWEPAFRSMQERLLRHVAEEEKKIFPQIRSVLSSHELSDLGEKMQFKKGLMKKTVGSPS